MIRILLEQNPDAAQATDPNSMLPIHFLARWGPSSLGVVDMLLLSNPHVLTAEAEEEGLTPLDMAKEGEYLEKDEVVDALSRLAKPNRPTLRPPMPFISRAPSLDAEGVVEKAVEAVGGDEVKALSDEMPPPSSAAPATVLSTPVRTMMSGVVGGFRTSPSRTLTPTNSRPRATTGHKTTISKLVEKLESTSLERDILKKDNGNFNETVASMKTRLSQLEKNLSAASRELESTRTKNGARVEEMETNHAAEIKDLRMELQGTETVAKDLAGKTENLAESIKILSGDLEMRTVEMQAANNTVSDLRPRLADAEALAEDLRLSRDGIVETVNGLTSELSEKDEELGVVSARVAELEPKLEGATALNEALGSERDELEERISGLSSAITTVTGEKASVESALAKGTKKLEESEAKNEELQIKSEQLEETEREWEVAVSALADKDDELGASNSECQELRSELEILKKEAAEMSDQLNEKDGEIEALNADMAGCQAEMDALVERDYFHRIREEDLGGHIIALSSSISTVMEERERIVSHLAEHEERLKKSLQSRQMKLRELMALEGGIVVNEEVPVKAEGKNEENSPLLKALERQRGEMEAISAILEAVNASTTVEEEEEPQLEE